MAATIHRTDHEAGHEKLIWPVGQPMTFYTVGRDDGGSGDGVPFVRDFHQGSALALQRQRKFGGSWRIFEWEWDPHHDEAEFVRVASPPINGGGRRVVVPSGQRK